MKPCGTVNTVNLIHVIASGYIIVCTCGLVLQCHAHRDINLTRYESGDEARREDIPIIMIQCMPTYRVEFAVTVDLHSGAAAVWSLWVRDSTEDSATQRQIVFDFEGPSSLNFILPNGLVLDSLMLRMLKGLEVEEQRELLKQILIEGMSPNGHGQLTRLIELELLGQLKLMRQMKLFKEEQEIFKTTKLQATLGSGILKMDLARLGKSGQESEREERLRLFLEHYKNLQQQLIAWLVIHLSEDDDRGSFRNLLLDGWWLEFWELILLMAGDVERNPGPRRMTDQQLASVDSTALEKDDLFEVYDAVSKCRSTWYNLCLALRVSDDDLSAIKKEQASDIDACLCKGLSLWLKGGYDMEKYGPPTWRVLVDAVANSSGGNNYALALKIADQYSSDKAIPLQISTLNCVDLEDNEKSEEMSSDFSRMYRSIIRHFRVDVCEVRDSFRFLTDPRHPDQLCVPPSVYKDATTTKELLTCLCPRYVNPKKTFVLKEIVREFGSQKCKKLLQDYTEKFQ